MGGTIEGTSVHLLILHRTNLHRSKKTLRSSCQSCPEMLAKCLRPWIANSECKRAGVPGCTEEVTPAVGLASAAGAGIGCLATFFCAAASPFAVTAFGAWPFG